MWTYFAFDLQGNAAQRLDASGNLRSASTYDAYGTETATGTLYADAYGHNARWGYYLDRQTGLYYCENRYYDPTVGRWVTRDPIGLAGGVNLYAYCESGPVGNADPEGLKIIIIGPNGGSADPHDENKIRRQLKRIGAPGSPLEQMIYDLINDPCAHYISPSYGPGHTFSSPGGDRLDRSSYNPWHDRPPPYPTGANGSYIPYPPDVTLAHELGHQDTPTRRRKRGKDDPGDGHRDAKPRAGDNVADVENPYRRWRGLPRRVNY